MKSNRVLHTRCAPYHPASNRLAERFVQSMKQALKTSLSNEKFSDSEVVQFLVDVYLWSIWPGSSVLPD